MLVGIPTGAIGTIVQILLAIPCAKITNVRRLVITDANIFPITYSILLWRLPKSNTAGLLGAYYRFYTYFAPYVLAVSLPIANTSGHTKKVTMNALLFISYSLGNILGAFIYTFFPW
jgi:MFS transporter, ACS family, allantoate permease